METLKIFGERLRALRDERHLRQADMAEVLQITLVHYQRMEYGKVNVPSLTLCFLADYFSVTTDYLLGRSDAGVNPFRAPVGATALGGPMVWPPLERVREVTNRPWKFGPPSGGHGDSAPAGGLSSRDAPPIFFSNLRKRKRAVHGPKEKAAWTRSGAVALRADGGRRTGACSDFA